VGQGLKLVLSGIALGLIGALALQRVIGKLLFGVSPTDPLTYAVIALLLIGVALLACWIPARPATKVDQLVRLRSGGGILRNWNHIVREHLAVLRLPPEREIEIVEEQALHLEAAYEDALADGLSAAEAEARALRSYDWRLLECELSRAEQPLAARALQPT